MTLYPRLNILVVFILGLTAGCATVPGNAPESPPVLPERHPEVGETHSPTHSDPRVDAYAAFARGLLLAEEGQFDRAADYLEMSVRLDPDSTAPLIELMRLQLETGMGAEAEQTGRKALAIDPDLGSVHIALGRLLLESDRVEEALTHLGRGAELEPENMSVLFSLAEAMDKSGDQKGALGVLEKLAATEGHEALADFYIGRLRLRSGDIQGAIDPLIRAVGSNPSFLRGVEELGQQMEKNNRAGDAIRLYQGYLEKDPEDTPVRGFLAKILLTEERYAEAGAHLDTILAKDPENEKALLLLGLMESRNGDFEKALEAFRRLRKVSGDSFETLMQIGSLQREMKMWAEAVATFEETARTYTNRFEPHLNLAIVYDATGEMEKAETSSRMALSLAPERSNIRTYLAGLLTRQERYEEAITLLREGLDRDPDDTVLLFQMGVTYDRSGRFDMTEEVLQRLLKADPDHPDALNYLGYSWAEQGRNLEEALRLIQRALRIRPDAAYIIDSLGWVHYQMGDYGKALDLLLKAVENMKDDPTVLDHLGDIYEKLGQEDLAVQYWSRALAADPDNAEIARKLREKGAIGNSP